MNVKAVDIARALGVSKATVSLALNNKPGISERTRQEILECRELLSQGKFKEAKIQDKNQILKVIIASRNLKVVYDSELDLWTDVMAVFDSEAKRLGYSVGVTYVDILKEDISFVVSECNQEFIAGVILYATELYLEDWALFREIEKPMVIYDNNLEEFAHHNIVADNRGGVTMAMEYLYARNKKQIVYLANEIDIYNFMQRRRGYIESIYEHNIEIKGNGIVRIGTTIDSVYRNMMEYIEQNDLPEAFIMENYQISIGVMRAFRNKKISIPKDISLIGIDEIPSYTTGDCKLTTIRIPHTDRARMVMLFLQREMERKEGMKSIIMTKCKLIEGNSVE